MTSGIYDFNQPYRWNRSDSAQDLVVMRGPLLQRSDFRNEDHHPNNVDSAFVWFIQQQDYHKDDLKMIKRHASYMPSQHDDWKLCQLYVVVDASYRGAKHHDILSATGWSTVASTPSAPIHEWVLCCFKLHVSWSKSTTINGIMIAKWHTIRGALIKTSLLNWPRPKTKRQ